MNYQFTYIVDGKEYVVNVTKKRVRNINYRFKDGEFYVSAHPLISRARIVKGLNQFARTLIQRARKHTESSGEDFIYILGERYDLNGVTKITLPYDVTIPYINKEDFEKKLKKYFLGVITQRVRYFEWTMDVKPEYKVRVQKMSSRYGSNSKHTHTLNFSTVLLHYSLAIIDTVVVHELAHFFVYNHSKDFYNVVYKYSPNYKRLQQCLKKGIFHE